MTDEHWADYLKGWIIGHIQTFHIRKCSQSLHITELVAGKTDNL